jgi:hypothetical protein
MLAGSPLRSYLNKQDGTGWDVAALTDANSDFKDRCGKCFEISCDKADVTDGYGQTFSRSGACYDLTSSVVVMITDG